ncbi:MAG TPA: protein translocase subunit SecF [Bryobacteraceae bacterium]|nr:protein translocase subunit SecF [Bryobacteraceae bacterium]
MELFKQTKFDFLRWKWPFIGASILIMAAGMISLVVKGGPLYGIDFRGGAIMDVMFAGQPPIRQVRTALAAKIRGDISVTTLDSREVLIGIDMRGRDERSLQEARGVMTDTLMGAFSPDKSKLEFNNAAEEALVSRLRDPLQQGNAGLSDEQLRKLVSAMRTFRDTQRSGLLKNFDELAAVPGVTPAVIAVLKQQCTLAPFSIRRVEVVGPKIGKDLQLQALQATMYALAGMLVYVAFRFEWIYGVAAVLAVLHDTIITVGLFSIFNKEIDLTVVAAILTLVGYSMNDTIVVFDRVRENLKTSRRESLYSVVSLSINQTLGRTVLTSGLTFLTAFSLFLFGGSVLHGFSFALVVGILVGTYSSIFIASPILVAWQNFASARKRPARAVAQ